MAGILTRMSIVQLTVKTSFSSRSSPRVDACQREKEDRRGLDSILPGEKEEDAAHETGARQTGNCKNKAISVLRDSKQRTFPLPLRKTISKLNASMDPMSRHQLAEL